MFDKLIDILKANPRKIVFTEGPDARILEACSGRFGLINETTRAAALRDYDEALSLLTGYYRRSYLENELFRR